MWVLPESSRHSFGPRRRQPLERHEQMSKTSLSQESQYQPVIIRGYIFDYCANTTVHGMKYIAERGRHWSERILWSLLCSMAACGSMYLSAKNWQRFVHSPTVSVIESTNFPISNIPFSSVTLCDANRVHWTKAMKFQKRYLPDASNETLKMFHKFVKAISVIEFGDFDILDLEFNGTFVNTPELSRLNITQLMFDVKPECKEMFSQGLCWWRNKDYNCCEIFELQRTEYGYCYAFNSEVSEVSTGLRKWYDTSAFYLYPPYYEAKDEEDELRPRRTNSYGTWGGLRFKVGTSNDAPPGSNILPGIIFIANNPYDYPQSGRVIPAGQAVYVDIDGQVTYTVERVRTLSVRERDCLYHDEGNSMGLGGYLYHNCISECHLKYTLKYCNCTPYFFYSYRGFNPGHRYNAVFYLTT
ncbi:sodium channel protein Nach-like [Periplaneta americana]|uniref:sodium channel protein Nach-like n=1 Tax=Periplaneta americana TaxID=6978 RepID=UPI0037E962E0